MEQVDTRRKQHVCSKCRVGDRAACALRPEHGRRNTDHFLNKHTGGSHQSERSGRYFYLLVRPVPWLEVAAGLFKPQVEVGESVEKVDPPRRRVADHRRHGQDSVRGSQSAPARMLPTVQQRKAHLRKPDPALAHGGNRHKHGCSFTRK